MGLLALQRLMSEQRDRQRRRRQILAQNRLIASPKKRNGLPCPPDADGDLQAGETTRCSIPDLPEDIWCHIHSLMPMRDAARTACLSHAFLRSWRCYPNLNLTRDALFPEEHIYGGNFSYILDSILRNHSGIGVKILNLGLYNQNLDNWLQVAVTPGIEELTLRLYSSGFKIKYRIPCSLLSDGVRNSIRYLELAFCIFRPTAELGQLGSLTSLHLQSVRITGDELRVPSRKLSCFRAVGTHALQGNNLPEDTLCAAALQLPEGSYMLEAEIDRVQSSKSLHYRLLWKRKNIACRTIANEELKHALFKCRVLCSC